MSLRGFNTLKLSGLSNANNDISNNGNGKDQPSTNKIPLASYFNESNIHQDIKITFTLPSGELFEEVVKNGETVQEIKRKLCSASKIPSNSEFFFNGKCMLDPLSLNDIPGVNGNSALQIEVKVKGQPAPSQPTPSQSTSQPTPSETSKPDAQRSDLSDSSQASTTSPKSPPTTNSTHSHPPDTLTDSDKAKQPPIDNAETTMYSTGNGKDERSNSSPRHPSELDYLKDEPSKQKTHNFVDPAPPTLTTAPSFTSASTIPSLPHAAFDEGEPVAKAVPEKPKESETTIDINDDPSKQIQTLGGGKRWYCELV